MIREQLAEVEPRSLMLILVMLGVLLATAMVVYMVKPQYQLYQERNVYREKLRNQIHDGARLQGAINEERKQMEAMHLRLHGEAAAVPVNEMESYLVGRLQELAWDAGIELASVNPGEAKPILGFEEISFNVDISGAYRNLYDWLNRIRDNLGFMLVSSYEIRLHGRGTDNTQLSMNMTIVFYRMADK